MASLTVAGYTFYVTTDGRVLVQGPGILVPGGIDLGLLSLLSSDIIKIAATGPGVDASATATLLIIAPRAAEIRDTLQKQLLSGLSSESTGDTVREGQQARDDGSNPVDPPTGPERVDQSGAVVPIKAPSETNAQQFDPATNTDSGTDAATRKNSQTQSTPGSVPAPGAAVPNNREDNISASQTSGVAKVSDDGVSTSANDVQALLNEVFGSAKKIVPTSNPLDKYASYTYSLSMYIMSPRQYQLLINTQQKNIPGMQLLMQSGGAPLSNGQSLPPGVGQYEDTVAHADSLRGRSQFFPLDFYMDDLRLTSIVQNRGTQTPSNVFELSFKIIEPNGISLLDNLYAATADYLKKESTSDPTISPDAVPNYAVQNYLMVVRFYGYDENGNLVKPSTNVQSGGGTDPSAIIEKWIPFQFTQIRFQIRNRLTEYECRGVAMMNAVATAQQRGVVPFNVELTAVTLNQLVNGISGSSATSNRNTSDSEGRQTANTVPTTSRTSNTVGTGSTTNVGQINAAGSTNPASTQSAAPPTAASAPKPSTKTVITGLVQALNAYQKEITTGPDRQFDVPDVYEIIIKEPELLNAKIVPPGQIDKSQTPMSPNTPDQRLGSKQSTDNSAQNKSIIAGTSILQVLDLAIRTSDYIIKQQKYTVDPVTKKIIPAGQTAQTVAWYHIGSQAVPIKYDNKRNDYAYKITYQISIYAITDPQSAWFNLSQFRGIQKRYSYWFTGENTQILDFYQDYNYAYYLAATGPAPNNETFDYRELIKWGSQQYSNESSQGNTGKTFEGAANLAGSLYSPADLNIAKMTILGDPDWIQQGEMVFGVPKLVNYDAFLKDGTINYDSQEPLFEIQYNKPVDYNLYTGIMDPGQQNYNANRKEGIAGEASQSMIYRARICTSIFNRGKFTQELDGTMTRFALPTAQTQAVGRQETQSSSQTTAVTRADARKLELQSGSYGPGTLTGSPKVSDWRSGYANSLPTGARSDSMAAKLANQSLLPSPSAQNPTSNGQIVGIPSVQSIINQAASGTNVGIPNTTITLATGEVRVVTSENQIRFLQLAGDITPSQASDAIRRLEAAIQNANNAINNSAPPLSIREF